MRYAVNDVIAPCGVVLYCKGDPMPAQEFERYFGDTPQIRTADGPSRARRSTRNG